MDHKHQLPDNLATEGQNHGQDQGKTHNHGDVTLAEIGLLGNQVHVG